MGMQFLDELDHCYTVCLLCYGICELVIHNEAVYTSIAVKKMPWKWDMHVAALLYV